MNKDIAAYNRAQSKAYKAICSRLTKEINLGLPKAESKVWHGSPVWFLQGNPVTGFAVRKNGVQLLFWSGQTFKEKGLAPEGSFKASQVYYTNQEEINNKDLKRWLKKAKTIQWDYKNIVKRRGKLIRLK